MSRNKCIVAMAVWMSALVVGMVWQTKSSQEYAGPQSIDEAASRCQNSGFHQINVIDGEGVGPGTFNADRTFTVCRRRFTADEANSLTVSSPSVKWEGFARIGMNLGNDCPNLKAARWGKVWVVGDPEFVDEIIR
mgnify:CR=1 FL=1